MDVSQALKKAEKNLLHWLLVASTKTTTQEITHQNNHTNFPYKYSQKHVELKKQPELKSYGYAIWWTFEILLKCKFLAKCFFLYKIYKASIVTIFSQTWKNTITKPISTKNTITVLHIFKKIRLQCCVNSS